MKTIKVCIASVAMFGCGAVVNNGNDATMVEIVSTIPTHHEHGIGVLTSMTATLSGNIDPSSLGGVQVSVGDQQVLGEVSWNADDHTLTFIPTRPLTNGKAYEWRVTGLMTASGNTIADVTAIFTTMFNPKSQDRFLNEMGTMTNYTAWEWNGNTYPRQRRYNDPGPDQVWFTADDTINEVSTGTYGDEGVVARLRYNGAGIDGEWFTKDDLVSFYLAFSYQAKTRRMVLVTDPGPDTLWQTGDDFVQSYFDSTQGRFGTTHYAQYLSGDDNQIGTGDDIVISFGETTYSKQGAILESQDYDPGPDVQPNTADDQIVGITTNEYDERRLLVQERYYNAPGLDGLWRSDDDVLDSVNTYYYDVNGNLTHTETVNLGLDGQLGTDDDWVSSKFLYEISETGLLTAAFVSSK